MKPDANLRTIYPAMTLERLLGVGAAVATADPIDIPTDAAERRRLREAGRLSADQAAILCGVTKRSLARWEHGLPLRGEAHRRSYGRLLAYCQRVKADQR